MSRRQAEILGTERPHSIAELDTAAEAFKRASKKRKGAQDSEIAARDLVVTLMKKHKLEIYEDREAGLIVSLESKDKVRVTVLEHEYELIEKRPLEGA